MTYSACDFADDVTAMFVENGLIDGDEIGEDTAIAAGLVIGTTRKLMNDRAAMVAALELARDLIPTARHRFPKSIRNRERFQLELTCAEISRALAKAAA